MVDLDNTGNSFLVADDQEATRMWQFGLKVWKLPGVRDSCLSWQVNFGIDVTIMIFLSWVGCIRRELITPGQVHTANEAISKWRQTVIEPVRLARKYVKTENSPERAELSDVFLLLRAVELRSELREQIMLLQWWRTQDKIAVDQDGFVQSIKTYFSSLATTDDTKDERELMRICNLVANIDC